MIKQGILINEMIFRLIAAGDDDSPVLLNFN